MFVPNQRTGFEKIFSKIQSYRSKHLSKVLLLKENKLRSQVRWCLHLPVIRTGWEEFMHMLFPKAKALGRSSWCKCIKQKFTVTIWKILSSTWADICSAPFLGFLLVFWGKAGFFLLQKKHKNYLMAWEGPRGCISAYWVPAITYNR